MSFEMLPEEILGKITKLASDACYYDAQYFAELDFAPEPGRDVWCAETRTRPPCFGQLSDGSAPRFFSRVLICAPCIEDTPRSWKISSLQLFRRLLSQRRHLAEHILSIGVGRDVKLGWQFCCGWPRLNMLLIRTPYLPDDEPAQISELIEIISLLPNLRDLSHDSLHEDFTRALANHDTLKRVDSCRCLGWDLDRDSVPSHIPLHRWYLADLTLVKDGDDHGLEHILSLGVNAARLRVCGREKPLLNASSYKFNAIEWLYIDDIEQIGACVVLEFAESMARRHPELREILFSSYGSRPHYTLSRTAQNFPLLENLISSTTQKFNNGQGQAFADFGYIAIYTIKKIAQSDDFLNSADTWAPWSITSLEFKCYL